MKNKLESIIELMEEAERRAKGIFGRINKKERNNTFWQFMLGFTMLERGKKKKEKTISKI